MLSVARVVRRTHNPVKVAACEAVHKGIVCAAVWEAPWEYTCIMEASMHGPFDKSPRGEQNIYQSWSMKLFALPLLLAIALIGYVVSHPDVAKWVADGVQAEFVGTDLPDLVPPTRIAQPSQSGPHNHARTEIWVTWTADWRRVRW